MSGKAVTGKVLVKEAQVSMFGGLLATAETKTKSVTKAVARASAQKKCASWRGIIVQLWPFGEINKEFALDQYSGNRFASCHREAKARHGDVID